MPDAPANRALISVFFERLPNHIMPRWYHAHAYYDFRKNECVNVIYPLNFAFQVAWWVNLQWSRHTKHPSWIDRQVKARSFNVANAEHTDASHG